MRTEFFYPLEPAACFCYTFFMYSIPTGLLPHVLLPLASAQLLCVVLIYFTIVRKRIAKDYKLYVCFLASFIIFLAGRAFQRFAAPDWVQPILLIRMTLLFAAGIPSLLIAAARQSGLPRSRQWMIGPYLIGLLISAGYIIFYDLNKQQWFFTPEQLCFLPFNPGIEVAHKIQSFGAMIMLVLPCTFLILRELRSNRTRRLLAFLTGSLIFGLLLTVGTWWMELFWIFYAGSIFSAACWSWAVFQDIRDLKGKSALLKEELERLSHAGSSSMTPEFEKLLVDLEELSHGNVDVYKMRIREILSRLTDATIEAGGDAKSLIQRHAERSHKVETSTDSAAIREILRTEAIELSGIIAKNKENPAVEEAKAYMKDHFDRDLGIDEIAEHLHVSRSHFMREFKKCTGQTANQHLTSLRMEKAKILLSKKSVTDTAFEVGYNNSNYFSTVFKKQTGISPTEFQHALEVEK